MFIEYKKKKTKLNEWMKIEEKQKNKLFIHRHF